MARIPYPAIGGDRIRAYNMIKMLQEKYELHVVLVTDEEVAQDCIDFLETNVAGYKIFKSTTLNFYWNSFKGIFSLKPLQVKYYHNNAAARYCRQEIKKDDIVVVHTIRMSGLVWSHDCYKVLDLVDSIYMNYLRSKYKVRSFFWKTIYFVEEKRLYKYEIASAKRFNKILLVNEDEKNFIETESGSSNIVFLPNGVNEELLERPIPEYNYFDIRSFSVCFLGKMNYQPNVDAVMWFANNVLPLNNNLKFYIIGTSPVKKVLDLELQFPGQVIVTGLVEDPYKIMSNTLALVAPMQTGGGIQNKILEAMSIGTVVLTTSLGAKPIQGAVHKKHLLICNSPQEYYKTILKLKDNNKTLRQITKNAKALIKHRYTWQLYKDKLLNMLESMYKKENVAPRIKSSLEQTV